MCVTLIIFTIKTVTFLSISGKYHKYYTVILTLRILTTLCLIIYCTGILTKLKNTLYTASKINILFSLVFIVNILESFLIKIKNEKYVDEL